MRSSLPQPSDFEIEIDVVPRESDTQKLTPYRKDSAIDKQKCETQNLCEEYSFAFRELRKLRRRCDG